MEITTSPAKPSSTPKDNTNYTVPLIIVTSLFFMWGFITVLNDILIPHLRGVFDLTHFQAAAVQMAFFGAYFFVSYPAGSLVKKVGYQKGVVIGLLVAGFGCAMFYPAASFTVYGIFLAALFVLASGITILQVAANPYVSLMGPEETSARRLTLAQGFNSLGTTISPIFGSMLILAAVTQPEVAAVSAEQEQLARQAKAEAVQFPYLMLAAALAGLAIVFGVLKNLPHIDQEAVYDHGHEKSAWEFRHLVLGAVAIFAYVGAEVSIGSFLVSYISQSNIGDMSEKDAGLYVSYYWGAAMVGRFLGVAIMTYVKPRMLLACNALLAIVLLIVGSFLNGGIAMWAILAIGLFNSVMFPTIFSLAINRLGAATSQASGILCMAIVGGAILPLVQGLFADTIGVQLSFLFPIVAYAFIIFYAMKGAVPRESDFAESR